MNEDEYRNNQLNKYLDEQDEDVSNCCGAEVYGDSDICSKCKEHCVVVSKQEMDYEEYENAMCDKADALAELRREED